ncbi:MAG: choice-of-anchor J domain-containing protein [Bacteroidia bacterium]|nr:choice-of-anchor J domain-containing protein [Bacteroidia bacterium]
MKKVYLFITAMGLFQLLNAQTAILTEDFSNTYSNYFNLTGDVESQAYIDNGSAIMTGGADSLWTGNGNGTTAQNAWTSDTSHHASLTTNFDGTGYAGLELKVRMRQTAGTSLKYSWFRVLINGVQISDQCGTSNFNPQTFTGDPFITLSFNLSVYAGTQFYLTLQSSCKMLNTDAVYIDNVVVYGSALNVAATIPYTQNFELYSMPPGWSVCQQAGSFGWQNGTAVSPLIPVHTGYAASVNIPSDGIICNNYLISPVFNFSGQSAISLQFDLYSSSAGTVVASTNGSTTWTVTLYTISATSGWQTIIIPLTAYSNLANFRFAFHHSDAGDASSQIAVDNISITGTATVMPDAGVSSLVSPVSGNNLSSSEVVSIQIHNFGTQAISNFPVSYQINNNSVVNQTVTSSVPAGQNFAFTFSLTADLSAIGSYVVKTWTNLAYDVNHSNDTLITTVICSEPTISTFPYYESFEGTTLWTSGGTNSSWEDGIPAKAFISSASNGMKAWVTNLDGPYNAYEASYVTSPNFNFSSLSLPIIELDVLCQTEPIEDGACLEYSTDHGVTWNAVGSDTDGSNWYNSPWITGLYFTGSTAGWNGTPFPHWVTSQHVLTALGGQQSVKFRMYFGSTENANQKEGFAFDNIKIFDTPQYDAGVTALVHPSGDCLQSSTTPATVTVTNFGYAPLVNLQVTLNISGTISTVIYPDTIPGDSSANVSFPNVFNLSLAGTYYITAYTHLPGDILYFNDTLHTQLVLTNPLSLPFSENFESGVLPPGWSRSQAAGSNGWLIGSAQSSSYFNVPSHTIYAASNDDVCNCDMSVDYLITPHLSFAGLNTVSLQFDAYNPGNYGSSGHILVSTDCGYSWTNVYDVPANTTAWQTLTVNLNTYAGYNNVKIAFHHNDGGQWASGFAVDNVHVTGTSNTVTQNINLPAGWCYFSTYINTVQTISSLVSPVLANVIIVKSEAGNVYWPQYGVNNIGNAVVGKAFQVKMTSQSVLPVTGIQVIPQNTPILIPNGWSLLGYLRNSPSPLVSMFGAWSSSIGIIKNSIGQVYWPYYGINSIGMMNPGEGYNIRTWTNINFTYPAN